MTLKQQVHQHYQQVVNDKIKHLQQVLADLKESSSNETKSTAGDKHETALAMLQIEQANTYAQLNDVLAKKMLLGKIDPSLVATVVSKGSLVKTNQGLLFLSVALGKASVVGSQVTALSPQSPLGQKLMGLSLGDVAEINQLRFVIENIA